MKEYKKIVKDLFSDYNEINKILNNSESFINSYFYSSKILDNIKNIKVLIDLLTGNNKRRLMISQPGSGKTYSLLKVANDLGVLTILAVPNRAQAEQIEQEYKELNVKAIVGGVNVCILDEEKHNIYVVVFDKLEEVLDRLKNEANTINLIIDEAQELVLATYREKLRDIEKNFTRFIKIFDNYLNLLNLIYLTATPNTLMYLNFDEVIEFKQEEKDVFPNEYYMYKVYDIKSGLTTKLIDNYNKGIRTLVRLNDKGNLRPLLEEILKEKCPGIRCSHSSSNDKTFKKDKDGNITYDNEMTNSVINESCLPDSDVLFCTSIFDKGINLNYIKNGELDKLEVIYVILNSFDCLIDNMIQTEARIRNKYYRFSIMTKIETGAISEDLKIAFPFENFEKGEFKYRKLLDLVKIYYKRLLRRKKYLEEEILYYKEDKYTKKEIINEIKEALNQETIGGYKASLDDSFDINDNLEIEVNLKNFFRFVYLKYNKQLYDNPDLIKDFFIKDFKDEEILSSDFSKIYLNTNDENVDDILEELKTNKNILTPSLSNQEEKESNTEKHNKLSRSWKFKEYYNLIELGKEEEEAIDLVKNGTKATITKLKNKLIVEDIKKITTKDIIFINEYVKHKEDYKNKDLKKLNLFTYKLKKTSYFEHFEKCVKKYYDLEKFIKYIEDGGKVTDFFEYEQYIKTNNKYINKEKVRNFDDKIQFFIIENIGKYENKDNSYITNKKVDELIEKIAKEFKETYTRKDLYKVLNKIFKVGENGHLNGLRLK